MLRRSHLLGLLDFVWSDIVFLLSSSPDVVSKPNPPFSFLVLQVFFCVDNVPPHKMDLVRRCGKPPTFELLPVKTFVT